MFTLPGRSSWSPQPGSEGHHRFKTAMYMAATDGGKGVTTIASEAGIDPIQQHG